MPELIILGSSNSIPTDGHENTHLALAGRERTVLIDCVGNPVIRLQQAGLELDGVTDLILTHFHPDHVGGVPLLMMDMWLTGRRRPLTVYGLSYTLDRLETMMGLYGWSDWPHFFPVSFVRLPELELTPVLDCSEFRILASPVRHLIPAIGLRVEFSPGGAALAYSCDTEPCEQVERLGAAADVLIHEASGPFRGHSSAAQAGEVARRAGARRLLLIHYPSGKYAAGDPVAEARQAFSGEVALAADWMKLDF